MNAGGVALALGAFVLSVLISAAGVAQTGSVRPDYPNPDLVPGPPPAAIFGLWAKGRKCAHRSGRLRISAHTLQFPGQPPIPYTYIPDVPHITEGSINFDDSQPDLIYDSATRTISDYSDDANPDHVYFPCFGPNPGWP